MHTIYSVFFVLLELIKIYGIFQPFWAVFTSYNVLI